MNLSRFDPALGKRIMSGVVLAAMSVAALLQGGMVLELALAAVIFFVSGEWAKLTNVDNNKDRYIVWLGVLVPAQIGLALTFFFGLKVGIASLVLSTFAVTGLLAIFNFGLINRTAFGAIYVGLPSLSILAIRDMPEVGAGLIIWMFLVIWTVDTGAYVAGRSIGGPKLAPVISPKKTWAGLLGGVSAAALIGAAASMLAVWPFWVAALIAAFLAVAAQMGDLFESHMKRQAGVKDSGSLIPGHGGFLDRVDGVMTTAPLMLLFSVSSL